MTAAGNRTRLKRGEIRVEQRKDTGVITGNDLNRPGETVKRLDGVNGDDGVMKEASDMPDRFRGQWIVCLVDIPSGDNEYIGPFHSQERAENVARRLRHSIKAIGADAVADAVVEWCRPAIDIEEIRDELLRSYGAECFGMSRGGTIKGIVCGKQ